MTELNQVTREVLENIKLVFPRFSWPDNERDRKKLVEIWAGAFAKRDIPVGMWREAFQSFVADATSDDNPPLPGDLVRHAEKAMRIAESDPRRRSQLESWRASKRKERDLRVGSVVGGVRTPSN